MLERLFLLVVSLLLLGGFGALGAAALGPRPALMPVAGALLGLAVLLACAPLFAYGALRLAGALRPPPR